MERRYAAVRITAGDYIQPSNDGRMLWRIYSYEEDGSAEFMDGSKLRGRYWATARYNRPFNNAGEWQDPDFLEWSNWLTWETTLPTKRAAIEAALQVEMSVAAREP